MDVNNNNKNNNETENWDDMERWNDMENWGIDWPWNEIKKKRPKSLMNYREVLRAKKKALEDIVFMGVILILLALIITTK